jgi:nucleoside-diphosphate-sugar epimerase
MASMLMPIFDMVKTYNIKVVRLSNVCGNNFHSHLFLPSIIRSAVDEGKISIRSSLQSQKDYIHIDDVVKILQKISLAGKFSTYNIAYGKNLKTAEIIDKIKQITNCKVNILPDAPEYSFPQISIERLKSEFNFSPISVLDKIEEMINEYFKSKNTY